MEVITTLAIVGLLLALLLPAIQSARETARNMTCQNKLRQLGLALHQYEGTHGMYPSSLCGHNLFSQFSVLLPYLDEKATYDLLVEFETPSHPRARELNQHTVAILICPSESEPPLTGKYTSYAGNSGTGCQSHGYDGMFQPLWGESYLALGEGPVRAADITDGLSNTVAFAEWLYQANPVTRKIRLRSVWETPLPLVEPDELEEFRRVCESIPPDPARYGWRDSWGKGTLWYDGNNQYSCYNHILGPNQPSCSNAGNVYLGAYSAGSLHPGSVNLVFADGHVDKVSDNVDLLAWREMGSRAPLTRRISVP